MLLTQAYDDGVVTEVIRPAAVVPEQSARHVLVELALHDVRMGGLWWSEPTNWRRYDMPWNALDGGPGTAELMGTMQICYGVPTRFDITIFRATITRAGHEQRADRHRPVRRGARLRRAVARHLPARRPQATARGRSPTGS